jgi:hypothetical protein
MFAKLHYTWSVMGASWDVLRRTKGLLVFPVLSSICCGLVAASFIIPMAMTGGWQPPAGNAAAQQKVVYYATLFAFYFCNYTVITFFNVAVVAGAISRMTGGEPTIGGCFAEATKRLHLILGWAALSATVGVVLRIIEDRSPKIGQFVAGLLGVAWALASFLVVPVLVVENKGPIAALMESGRLLRKTWGEQVVGNFSFGLVFMLLMLPGAAIFGLGLVAIAAWQMTWLGVACISIAVVYVIGLALVQSTLQVVFQAAVFMYAQGNTDHGFPPSLMHDIIVAKT